MLILLAGCGKKNNMPEEKSYRFTVKKQLTEQEVDDLRKQHYPKLVNLSRLYAPQVDLASGFPAKPEFFDIIRTKWLLDESNDKPPFHEVLDALGLGFGLLLEQTFDMKWCVIVDDFGESISMVCLGNESSSYEQISFPQYSYIEKREAVMNAEVFSDGYRKLNEMIKN